MHLHGTACIYTARQLATCFQTIVGSCATGSLNTWLFAMYLCLPLRVCCWQEGITESFKPKYRLRSIRLCVPWWDGEMTAAAARNAARPLALQGSAGPKAKLRQAAQQLAAAATHAAASLPASRSRYGRLMRRALGGLNGAPAAAAASDSGASNSVHGGSSAGAAAATGDSPAAAAGLAVLVLEYPRPAGTRGAASSAELRFLGKYRCGAGKLRAAAVVVQYAA